MKENKYRLKRIIVFALIPVVLLMIPFLVWSGNNKVLTNFEIIGYEQVDGVYALKKDLSIELLIETEYQESMTIGYWKLMENHIDLMIEE